MMIYPVYIGRGEHWDGCDDTGAQSRADSKTWYADGRRMLVPAGCFGVAVITRRLGYSHVRSGAMILDVPFSSDQSRVSAFLNSLVDAGPG